MRKLVFALLLLPSVARADLVTIDFSSTATNSATLFGMPVSPGDVLAGSFSYDTTVADFNSDPNAGFYNQSSLAFTVNGHSFAAPSYTLSIINDKNQLGTGMLVDAFGVSATTGLTMDGNPTGNGIFTIFLVDRSATVFSSDAIPASIHLSSFDNSSVFEKAELDDYNGTPKSGFFHIDTLGPNAVPEPGSLMLMGLGGLGLLVRRLRR